MKRLLNIFKKLASVNCPSFKENRIMPFIIKHAFNNGFKVSLDDNFNIIVVRRNPRSTRSKLRKLPMLCAHMDNITVNKQNLFRGISYDYKTGIISAEDGNVIGGDDKCGIAIIMRIMELAPKRGYEFIGVFTRGEERGSGARDLNPKTIDAIKWGIVLDRRGYNDVVTRIYGKKLCSESFSDWVCSQAPMGTNPVKISSCHSDASPLKDLGIRDVVNLSVGYHDPHSTRETVNLNQMYNSFMWTENMIISDM